MERIAKLIVTGEWGSYNTDAREWVLYFGDYTVSFKVIFSSLLSGRYRCALNIIEPNFQSAD